MCVRDRERDSGNERETLTERGIPRPPPMPPDASHLKSLCNSIGDMCDFKRGSSVFFFLSHPKIFSGKALNFVHKVMNLLRNTEELRMGLGLVSVGTHRISWFRGVFLY